jgi:hypothetical protein
VAVESAGLSLNPVTQLTYFGVATQEMGHISAEFMAHQGIACAPVELERAVMNDQGTSLERNLLIRKLESIADLTPEETQALLEVPMIVKAVDAES